MAHNIISLSQLHFNSRIIFGGCLLNVNGETIDCDIDISDNNTYTIINHETKEEVGTFRPYHIHGGPIYFQIEGLSQSGGDGTLIVPEHDMLTEPDDIDDQYVDDPYFGNNI